MLPLTRSRNRARFFGAPFSPASLFAGGTVAGAWYDPSDLSTLFTTSAGTTPVAMPGLGAPVPVGLMLDKSQGLVLGSELVTNGTFDTNISGWSAYSGLLSAARDTTIFTNGGLKIVANGGASSYATQTISGLTVGRQYVISTSAYTPSTNPTNNRATIGTQASGFTTAGSIAQTSTNVIQTLTIRFFATSTTQTIYCSVVTADFVAWGANGAEAYFDNISVRELPGNHAIAFNNTTARPELRARVNLLTYSEDWTNAVWTAASDRTNVTTTPNAGINPIGGSNATRLQGTANNWFQGQTVSLTSLTPLVLSLWVKSNTGSSQTFRLFGTGTAQISSDLTATTDWQQFLFPYTPTNTAQQCGIIRNSSNSTADLLIWGADLRPANIGANVPAYQRIADANTYDTSGFPLYLRFDGIDDSMYTPANLNLSGTDKVAVFAGVRKLSASTGFVAETSAAAESNNGAFRVGTDSGGIEYFISSRGTTSQQVNVDNAAYTSPVTNVVQSSFDIAAPLISVRINSAAVGSNTSSQGTGNFGTYPLYVGSRNNASFRFDGQIYSLIIAGSAVSAGNISATEQWVAQKTGLVIP